MPIKDDLAPLAQTKGLSLDASEVLTLVNRWHAEKVPDGIDVLACCDSECRRCTQRTNEHTRQLHLTLIVTVAYLP